MESILEERITTKAQRAQTAQRRKHKAGQKSKKKAQIL
jgi:hypothetical protein